jgi:hypothetical protein
VSEPEADRGPHAGSPRGVVVATGSWRQPSASANDFRNVNSMIRSLSLPVLTPTCSVAAVARSAGLACFPTCSWGLRPRLYASVRSADCAGNASTQTARVNCAPGFCAIGRGKSLGHLQSFTGQLRIKPGSAEHVLATERCLSVTKQMDGQNHARVLYGGWER